MDAVTTAAEQMVREGCKDLRAAIAGLDSATLAREPAPETSSLATLVRHSVTATRTLLRAASTGAMNRQRYRDEERTPAFENRQATEGELTELLDGLESDAARLLAETPLDRLGDEVVWEGPVPGDPSTRAYMLLHAVEHLREHVGHAQLTRQVLAPR